jgi:uncharacterized protein (DUF608 family)
MKYIKIYEDFSDATKKAPFWKIMAKEPYLSASLNKIGMDFKYVETGQSVWFFKGKGLFDEVGYYYSENKIFQTKRDCENYLINLCNDMQTKIMNSNDFTDDAKQKYGEYILNNREICEDFIYEIADEFADGNVRSEIEIREEMIEGNIEIRDDIKMKLDANKYNI